MNISGLIVYSKPETSQELRGALAAIPGVEVHAVTPEGRIVVTIEQTGEGDQPMTQTFDRIAKLEGVLSTALVYHHDEALPE